jgi:hypothetical protein
VENDGCNSTAVAKKGLHVWPKSHDELRVKKLKPLLLERSKHLGEFESSSDGGNFQRTSIR